MMWGTLQGRLTRDELTLGRSGCKAAMFAKKLTPKDEKTLDEPGLDWGLAVYQRVERV
jgi:hypothetical protein